jgi:N-acetylglucosamine-6-sulfatase
MTFARRCLIPLAVAAMACVLVAAPSSRSSVPSAPVSRVGGPPRHNIIFVLTDDLSRDLVPYMAHVRGLRDTGASFDNYTVTDSLCCPSRSSILTGRFPHDTRIFSNGGNDGGFRVFHRRGEEKSTIGTDLQAAGYRTGFFGKYLNGYQPDLHLDGQQHYVPPGWNDWDVTGNGYPEYNYTLNHNHALDPHGSRPRDYLVDVMRKQAVHFISTSAALHKPFMLEVATFAPHAPYTPAPRDIGTFARAHAPRGPAFNHLPRPVPAWLRGYPPLKPREVTRIDHDFRKRVEAVQSVDRLVGAVEHALSVAHLTGTTDIVFSSDNGYHMGQYHLRPGKMTAFDTDIEVPLIASGPDIAHRTITAPAENIDLRSTFDAIAHTSPPRNVDGHSLLGLLNGDTPPNWRNGSLVEHHGPDTTPGDPDHPGKFSGDPPSYTALRTKIFTFVQYRNGRRELYNHARDPHELHNLVRRAPSDLLHRLHREVYRIRHCHGAVSCWRAAH